MTYRRREGRDTWHWCRNCRWWPTPPTRFKQRESRPSGELCNECRAKTRHGACR